MAKLVGGYIDEMAEVFTASAISGMHACAIGAPGFGKTDLCRALMTTIIGNDDLVFEIESTTPADEVKGPYDNELLLSDKPKLVRITEHAITAPGAKIIGIDEWGRANDAVMETFIKGMARKDIPRTEQPVFWMTSNFAPKSERLAAVIDRVALWFWIPKMRIPQSLIKAIVEQQAAPGGEVTYGGKVQIPTIQEIEDVRNMQPTAKAVTAVQNLIATLEEEVFTQAGESNGNAGFSVNPRRITQWSRLLTTVSMWKYGTEDFSSVHPDAVKLLKYAYPLKTLEEAQKWAALTEAVVDVVGTAIASIKADAYASFRQIKQANNSLSARSIMAIKLTEEMGKRQREFTEICGDDPRVQDAIQELSRIHAAIVRGENPVELEG